MSCQSICVLKRGIQCNAIRSITTSASNSVLRRNISSTRPMYGVTTAACHTNRNRVDVPLSTPSYQYIQFQPTNRSFGSTTEPPTATPKVQFYDDLVKNSTSSSSTNTSSSSTTTPKGNARATAKMITLTQIKVVTNQARTIYKKAQDQPMKYNTEATFQLKQEWIRHEIQLNDAYSKAIKYTAKNRHDANAALKSENLLNEMLGRFGFPNGRLTNLTDAIGVVQSLLLKEEDSSTSHSFGGEEYDLPDLSEMEGVPLPTVRDFHNVLHSWTSSKARKKGLRAEFLILKMIELSSWYGQDVFGLPDSKTFALAVKCYSGSTLSMALDKIIALNELHDHLTDCPGVVKDDPYLLMQSVKGVRNYRKRNQIALLDDWSHRLHSFVIDPSNETYVHGRIYNTIPSSMDDQEDSTPDRIDLTGYYTNMIRGFSHIKGEKGAFASVEKILDQVQELSEYNTQCKKNGTNSIATAQLKVNAYNLLLTVYRDNRQEESSRKALQLLEDMIKSSESLTDLPAPTDQSYAICISSLIHLKDTEFSKKRAEQLLTKFESFNKGTEIDVNRTSKPYNAFLELLVRYFEKTKSQSADLLPSCSGVIHRMEKLGIKPDASTWSMMLRACGTVTSDVIDSTEKLETANDIFEKLISEDDAKAMQEDADNSNIINDKCFFYMMKCVAKHTSDNEEKRENVSKLFSTACNKGMCSADVLKIFQNMVSEDDYVKIVGDGRLPQNWIKNVTSGRALYSDGTTGGEGKNARRKGKSTSNWAQKQRVRKESVATRKQAKTEKKWLKKGKR